MAKRKTKKEKMRSSERIERMTYSLPSPSTKAIRSLDYGYDTGLVAMDLRKTVLISLIILALELVAYFQLR